MKEDVMDKTTIDNMIFDEKRQKRILDMLVSSPDVFVRVKPILKPIYFDVTLQKTVSYILKFYNEFNTLPNIEYIELESNFKLEQIPNIDENKNLQNFAMQTTEAFCRRKAIEQALQDCSELVEQGKAEGIDRILKDALLVSISHKMGINIWEQPDVWLKELNEILANCSTGWKKLDNLFDGGWGNGELEYIVAPPNGGKSLALANFATNWSIMGETVIYFTIEMDEKLVGRRIASMITSVPGVQIKGDGIDTVAKIICDTMKDKKPGRLQVVNLKDHANIHDIEAYVKEFEINYNVSPTRIIVDYADLMAPTDSRLDPNNIHKCEGRIAEELRAFVKQRTSDGFPCLALTASQVTKETMDDLEFTMGAVAGSQVKSRTADNMISISMSNAQTMRGQLTMKILKSRNAGAKDAKLVLGYDKNSLRITNEVLNGGETATMDIASILKQAV